MNGVNSGCNPSRSAPTASRAVLPCEVGMHENPRSRLAAYGVALLATAVSLSVRWPLRTVLGDRSLYAIFFPAVMIAAYLGGFGPGLLATLLSALAVMYFFLEPHT